MQREAKSRRALGAMNDFVGGIFDFGRRGGKYEAALQIPMQHELPRMVEPVAMPRMAAPQRTVNPHKRGRQPGSKVLKECRSCHSRVPAALSSCPDCGHLFRERKIKAARTGKRGKKRCPKCELENPAATTTCKKCGHVFRLKIQERYSRANIRAEQHNGNTDGAAAAASRAAAHGAHLQPLPPQQQQQQQQHALPHRQQQSHSHAAAGNTLGAGAARRPPAAGSADGGYDNRQHVLAGNGGYAMANSMASGRLGYPISAVSGMPGGGGGYMGQDMGLERHEAAQIGRMGAMTGVYAMPDGPAGVPSAGGFGVHGLGGVGAHGPLGGLNFQRARANFPY